MHISTLPSTAIKIIISKHFRSSVTHSWQVWTLTNHLDWIIYSSWRIISMKSRSILGQTQLICCFSDPPVHWSLQKVRKNPRNKKYMFLIDNYYKKKSAFSCLFFLLFLFLLLLTLWNGSRKDLRNNTSIMSGLSVNLYAMVGNTPHAILSFDMINIKIFQDKGVPAKIYSGCRSRYEVIITSDTSWYAVVMTSFCIAFPFHI